MADQGLQELKRLFGEGNVAVIKRGNTDYYQLNLKADQHAQAHLYAVQAYCGLLEKLHIHPEEYQTSIAAEEWLIKKSQAEMPDTVKKLARLKEEDIDCLPEILIAQGVVAKESPDSGGFKELVRIFGAHNMIGHKPMGEHVYELTFFTPSFRGTDAEQKKTAFESKRLEMYVDLLDKLGLDFDSYKDSYKHGLLYLREKDIEQQGIVTQLENLSSDKIDSLPILLKMQRENTGGVNNPPFPPSGRKQQEKLERIREKLEEITGAEWRLVGDEGAERFQTLAKVPSAKSAAFALGDPMDNLGIADHLPKDSGYVVIPASMLRLEKLEKLKFDKHIAVFFAEKERSAARA